MTTPITLRSIFTASALAVIGALAVIAQTGTASAANAVLSCDGSSRRSVVECCETLVRKSGSPMWMKREGKNCRTAALVCTTKTYGVSAVSTKKVCRYVNIDTGGGGKTPPGGRNPGGGNSGQGQSSNNSQSGGKS